MTLQVPFEQFAEAASRTTGSKEAHVARHPNGIVATAANPRTGALVAAVSGLSFEEAAKQLESSGMTVSEGVWSAAGEVELEGDAPGSAFVGAVSYLSSESVPGVWVDAFPEQPTHVQVLRSMYEEFRQTGELGEVSFEEFVRWSKPNVVIVSPDQMRSFLQSKARKHC